MKILDHIPAWLKNKYVLTLLGLGVWMLFFDDRDLVTTYYRQRSELRGLRASKAYYQQQIEQTRAELDQLKVNAAVVEKYAREKYLMKRDNEDLFVVTPAR
jgi:cell division protein DivIC